MNLNENNYYTREADEEYMSVSQYKDFRRCEAQALARLRGEVDRQSSTALLVGSYVDAALSGTLGIFRADHPELFKKDGTLKADYAHADLIIERIMKQAEMLHYMTGESQRIFTGEIAGIRWKCKVDSYLPGEAIVDGKVMKDFAPIYVEGAGRVPWWEAWGYDTQGAVYQELVRQETGETLPFILSAATKEPEPDLALLQISQTMLDYELGQVRENAPRYDAIKKGLVKPERCEKCAYCRRTRKVTLMNTEDLIDEAE